MISHGQVVNNLRYVSRCTVTITTGKQVLCSRKFSLCSARSFSWCIERFQKMLELREKRVWSFAFNQNNCCGDGDDREAPVQDATRTNYAAWVMRMKFLPRTNGAWGAVDRGKTPMTKAVVCNPLIIWHLSLINCFAWISTGCPSRLQAAPTMWRRRKCIQYLP